MSANILKDADRLSDLQIVTIRGLVDSMLTKNRRFTNLLVYDIILNVNIVKKKW